jgi:peptidoglycan/LPS O-acetylase OafA/YrhL
MRFFAAFFVIISHANISLAKINIIPAARDWAFLNRGSDAVEFFFVLSGFLITYLLLKEREKTNTISIKQFYLRRVLRIWPLYFLVGIIGFVVLGIIYPLYTGTRFGFSIGKAILLYLFFLPNLATSIYQMGLLYPLWSIGVEEQFYLFWAPMMKACKHQVLPFLLIVAFVSATFYSAAFYTISDHATAIFKFIMSLKFWAMSIGGIFGYILFNFEKITISRYLVYKPLQVAAMGIVSYHYLIGESFCDNLFWHFFIALLYGIIILNSCLQSSSVTDLEKKPFVYLGTISFGLYMYHMIVDYVVRMIYTKFASGWHPVFAEVSYYLVLLGTTIIVASLSYKYFESFFLRMKHKIAVAN